MLVQFADDGSPIANSTQPKIDANQEHALRQIFDGLINEASSPKFRAILMREVQAFAQDSCKMTPHLISGLR